MTTSALFRNKKLKQHGLKSRHTSLKYLDHCITCPCVVLFLFMLTNKNDHTLNFELLCCDAGSTI